MNRRCRPIEKRMQVYFDGTGELADGDLVHIHGCRRCGGAFRSYTRFRSDLRKGTQNVLAELDPPDWDAMFSRARTPVDGDEALSGGRQPANSETKVGLEPRPSTGEPRRSPSCGLVRAGDWKRPYLRRVTGNFVKAAAILVVVGIGGVVGFDGYQITRARSFLRSDTSEFVSRLFASPFFPSAKDLPISLGADSGWFDASGSPLGSSAAPVPGPVIPGASGSFFPSAQDSS